MTRLTDRKVFDLLRDGMPSADPAIGPRTDLWPSVRHRIHRRTATPPAADWVLAVALGAMCLLRPALVGLVLLHF